MQERRRAFSYNADAEDQETGEKETESPPGSNNESDGWVRWRSGGAARRRQATTASETAAAAAAAAAVIVVVVVVVVGK